MFGEIHLQGIVVRVTGEEERADLADRGIYFGAAATRRGKEIIATHDGRLHRVGVVNPVGEVRAFGSEIAYLQHGLPGKLPLRVQIPLLNVTAAGVVLVEAIAEIVCR